MRRVVITGMGSINALGFDAPTSWQAMREGRVGIGPIANIPTELLQVKIAAEVRGLRSVGAFRQQAPGPARPRLPVRSDRRARSDRPIGPGFPRRRQGRTHRLHRRHRHRRREHPRRDRAALLRRQEAERASVDDRAPDGERARLPGHHGVRPYRTVIRGSQCLRLGEPRDVAGLRNGAQWEGGFRGDRSAQRSLHHRAPA